MVMNLYILFLISLPEAILNLYILLQLSGRNYLDFKDKKNILRFIATIILMLTASLLIRPHVPNTVVNIIAHSAAYMIIVFLVYRISLPKAIFCVSLILMLNASIENLYVPFIAIYVSKGFDNFASNYQFFFIYCIPYRLLQLFVIWMLKKYDIVFDMVALNKTFQKAFIGFMYIISFLGFCFSNILFNYFQNIDLFHQILFCSSISIMVFISSWLVFYLIYVSIKGILAGGYRQYQKLENDTSSLINEVYGHLKDNNNAEALKILDGYMGNKQ